MDDKRTNTRVPYEAEIDVELNEETRNKGLLVNISTGGALIKNEPLPTFGEKLLIYIDIPGVPNRCVIPCIVRWIKQGEGAGLQFEHLRPIEVWAINRLKRNLAMKQNSE